MNPKERMIAGHYIRHVADHMGLRDWDLVLASGPPETDGALGEVCCCEGRRTAAIFLSDRFPDLAEDEQTMIVVHELVHCHLAAATQMVDNDLTDLVSRGEDVLFSRAWHRNMETGVDGIATAWSEHFPPIDWTGDAAQTDGAFDVPPHTTGEA